MWLLAAVFLIIMKNQNLSEFDYKNIKSEMIRLKTKNLVEIQNARFFV